MFSYNNHLGVEWNNADLYLNYNKAGSWDLNDDDDDPMPDHTKGLLDISLQFTSTCTL